MTNPGSLIEVRPLEGADRAWEREFLLAYNHSLRVVSRGVLHHPLELPGFIGSLDGIAAGLLTYHRADRDLEVVTLHAAQQRRGLGSALLEAARKKARELGSRRLWLITGRHMRLRCDGQSGPSSGG
jgi:GNAT superfamily N-acetyltransferase